MPWLSNSSVVKESVLMKTKTKTEGFCEMASLTKALYFQILNLLSMLERRKNVTL